MTTITLTDKQLEEIWKEDYSDYELVEYEEWEDCGKFQTVDFIFKSTETGKFYAGFATRHGNYYSGYEYNSDIWSGDGETHELQALTKVKRVVETTLYVVEPKENDIIVED